MLTNAHWAAGQSLPVSDMCLQTCKQLCAGYVLIGTHWLQGKLHLFRLDCKHASQPWAGYVLIGTHWLQGKLHLVRLDRQHARGQGGAAG